MFITTSLICTVHFHLWINEISLSLQTESDRLSHAKIRIFHGGVIMSFCTFGLMFCSRYKQGLWANSTPRLLSCDIAVLSVSHQESCSSCHWVKLRYTYMLQYDFITAPWKTRRLTRHDSLYSTIKYAGCAMPWQPLEQRVEEEGWVQGWLHVVTVSKVGWVAASSNDSDCDTPERLGVFPHTCRRPLPRWHWSCSPAAPRGRSTDGWIPRSSSRNPPPQSPPSCRPWGRSL